MFNGTGASRGKCDTSDLTFLPYGGGETTERAIPEYIIHNCSLHKPEVGIFDHAGSAVSVIVPDHSELTGREETV